MTSANTLERFWVKVKKTPTCWNWFGASPSGYGRFWSNGRLTYAYRFSYEITKGKIPKGLQLDHLCRNPKCVNPDHLEAVTAKENNARSNSPSAKNKAKERLF